MKIAIKIKANNFTTDTKEEMWNIYKAYYTSNKVDFMKRMETNNQFAIYKYNGNIVGFTGMKINRTKIDGENKMLIYFGQTVIGKKFRGNALLPITALKVCLKYFKTLIFSDIYFWYDALTYKSYLISAKTTEVCYPSRKQQTPNSIKKLINYIGQKHYKESYCKELGTVVKTKVFVSDPSVRIGSYEERDADVQFFMKANPNHQKGHGLITITPMSKKNVMALVKRYRTKISKNTASQLSTLIQSIQLQMVKFNNLLTTSI